MKLKEFKTAIEDRLVLLRAALVYTFQIETVSWLDNWTSLLSTTLYTVAVLVLINVIYANVKSVVGYDRNEMLLLLFIGQLGVYVKAFLYHGNLITFAEEVNNGNLDLILSKPIPALFYITFRRFGLISLLRDAIIPLGGPFLAVSWATLHFETFNIFIAFIVFWLGLFIFYVLELLAALSVIWLGDPRVMMNTLISVESSVNRRIPLQGFSFVWQFIFSTILPVMISASFVTAILLNKSNPMILLSISILVSIAAYFIKDFAWNKALRSYTSASS